MAGKSQRPGAGRAGSPRRSGAPARPRPSSGASASGASASGSGSARPKAPVAPAVDDHRGDRIIVASWASVVLFVVATVPAALGVSAFDDVAVGVPFALFLIGVVVMVWAYAVGLARTTRGDNVVVSNLYLLAGSAPRRVQLHLFGALGASIAAAAALAAWNPAGVLVPILPLALNGLWAARHGTFPPRPGREGADRNQPASAGRRRGGRPGQ